MTTASDAPGLRIAITGGGLAGATLAHALIKHSHLDVRLYESASEFSERGAAVGLSGNAQRALVELGLSLREALDKAGAVRMNSSRIQIGSGRNSGTLVFDLGTEEALTVVHRASFLRELLQPVPRSIMYTSKKLIKVDDADDKGVLLHFKDGTTELVDALIGADGVHGYVRKHILGADHPATEPVFAGWWDCRNLVPYEKAREKLGEKYFEEDRQYGWLGEGGFIMHDVLEHGKLVQCVGAILTDEPWDSTEWKRSLDQKKLEESFAPWLDGPIAKGMIELLLDQEEPLAFSQWEHKNAPTYVKGRVCVIGDAAHALTPWQGSGAGQAIEDAMILETLLATVKNPEQLGPALKVYDEVRRTRTQRIAESSRLSGRIMCGKGDGVGLDPDKLREALAKRWEFIHEFDLKKHKEEALALLNQQSTSVLK
ncbi:MAG: hypothetical protein MMC33_006780 [Icmadophila ericetorum]|nr:hypothetical protein [Icmadophila ericetorum]